MCFHPFFFLKYLQYCAIYSQHWLIYIRLRPAADSGPVLSLKGFDWAACGNHMQRGFSRQRGAQPQEGHRGQADYLLQLWQAQGSAGLPKFTRSYWHSAAALSHYQISRELSGLRINSSVSCFKISVKPEPETGTHLICDYYSRSGSWR